MIKTTAIATNLLPTRDQLGMLSVILLPFLAFVLEHYTHWDLRACFLLAAAPIWIAQGFLYKTPPKKWAIQIGLSVVIFLAGWEMLTRLWH